MMLMKFSHIKKIKNIKSRQYKDTRKYKGKSFKEKFIHDV